MKFEQNKNSVESGKVQVEEGGEREGEVAIQDRCCTLRVREGSGEKRVKEEKRGSPLSPGETA